MPERGEGRLARWSRLKVKGGASSDEHAEAEAELEERASVDTAAEPKTATDVAERSSDFLPDPSSMPGGVQQRKFVDPMAPLAEPEEDEVGYAAAPPEALAMLEGEVAHDAALPVDPEERELTPEEQEVVDQLPPIESLKKESDFTPFLAQNVPDFIRKRAMRALWLSDSFFGFQDGLDDYAENFRVIDKLINAATESSYRPGEGYDLGEEDEVEEADEDVEAVAAEAAEDVEPATASDGAEEIAGEDAEDAAAAEEADETNNVDAEPEPERLASSSVRKPGEPA